jgi:hypothetical protein
MSSTHTRQTRQWCVRNSLGTLHSLHQRIDGSRTATPFDPPPSPPLPLLTLASEEKSEEDDAEGGGAVVGSGEAVLAAGGGLMREAGSMHAAAK